MRYQNWDVLVFPDECKIPLQEFKTICQVVHDTETSTLPTTPSLLPTVTSFIPGLPAGTAFRISIHSWQTPQISPHVQAIKKPENSVHLMFEARLFIDGLISGTKWFDADGPWPSVIDLSIDLDKHGEFEKLRFPTFHKDVLTQSYWNAGDDFGRIKLILAEGYSQDKTRYPFERVKNVVSFSFQHAPLDVLETSSIAWPNAAMWRQIPHLPSYYTSPHRSSHIPPELHTHSPRKVSRQSLAGPPPFARQDPFTSTSTFQGWRQSSDASMGNASNISRANTHSSSRVVTDPMIICQPSERQLQTLQSADAFDSLCEALNRPAPPSSRAPSGKENFSRSPPLAGPSKRQRVVTPASVKAIDPMDEPKSNAKQEILGTIENI